MYKIYDGGEEEFGFQLNRQRSRKHPVNTVTDFDFADDMALLMEEMEQSRNVLGR